MTISTQDLSSREVELSQNLKQWRDKNGKVPILKQEESFIELSLNNQNCERVAPQKWKGARSPSEETGKYFISFVA